MLGSASLHILANNYQPLKWALALPRVYVRIMRNLINSNLLATLLFFGGAFNAPAHNQASDHKIINLADDFYSVYQSSRDFSPEKRTELFSEHFTSKFGPFYTDKDFIKSIESFSEIEEIFLLKNEILSKNLKGSMELFTKAFPDFKTETPIYILHSLGRFNGATRDLNNKSYLMFGVDMMAKYHIWKDDTPFFHHELFHVYHENYFQCKKELWCSLWTEGLATYVSHQLNSSANNNELMLNIPENMIENVHSRLLYSLTDLKSKFYSKEPEENSSFFNFRKDETNLPYRRGYYLGYILAQKIGKNYSIAELAKMDKKTVEQLLSKELDLFIEQEG